MRPIPSEEWAQVAGAKANGDRNEPAGDWLMIVGFTRFRFAARNGKYSTMGWRWWHFDSISYYGITNSSATRYRIKGKHLASCTTGDGGFSRPRASMGSASTP